MICLLLLNLYLGVCCQHGSICPDCSHTCWVLRWVVNGCRHHWRRSCWEEARRWPEEWWHWWWSHMRHPWWWRGHPHHCKHNKHPFIKTWRRTLIYAPDEPINVKPKNKSFVIDLIIFGFSSPPDHMRESKNIHFLYQNVRKQWD